MFFKIKIVCFILLIDHLRSDNDEAHYICFTISI